MHNLIYHINDTASIVDAWEQGLEQTYQENLHNKELHNFKKNTRTTHYYLMK